MPEVFVNTSPIQYLHQLGLLGLLPQLYGEVGIPHAVIRELEAGHALKVALPNLPLDTGFQVVADIDAAKLPLDTLGAGERQVIACVASAAGCLGIVDDQPARKAARALGLKFTGTLGVLLRAKERKLVLTVRPLLDQLIAAGFRIDEPTRREMLQLAHEE